MTQIGSYRIGEKVGQGAFGTVYKGMFFFLFSLFVFCFFYVLLSFQFVSWSYCFFLAVLMLIKALDGDSGDFVAIKRIRVDKIKNKQLMKLLAEGHLMEQLDHENIVKFHGALEVRKRAGKTCESQNLFFFFPFWKTDNHICLIMEFVDSGSLASVVSKYGNLSEKLAATYLKQVLDGLAYLHGNNVVHRDVKKKLLCQMCFSFFWLLFVSDRVIIRSRLF